MNRGAKHEELRLWPPVDKSAMDGALLKKEHQRGKEDSSALQHTLGLKRDCSSAQVIPRLIHNDIHHDIHR